MVEYTEEKKVDASDLDTITFNQGPSLSNKSSDCTLVSSNAVSDSRSRNTIHD